jgi:hypothetical protein
MNPTTTKAPYRKPAIERISLVGEETAAVPNCKRDNGGGMNRTYPNPCRTEWFWDLLGVRCRESRGS